MLWDGAIAHFVEAEMARVMENVCPVLSPKDGVLTGSEALEAPDRKTWDHHLAFPEPQDIKDFLGRYFPVVLVKEIPPMRGRYREVYFRCAYEKARLKRLDWQ